MVNHFRTTIAPLAMTVQMKPHRTVETLCVTAGTIASRTGAFAEWVSIGVPCPCVAVCFLVCQYSELLLLTDKSLPLILVQRSSARGR